MEKLQFHKIHLPPFAALLFLLQFLSVAYSLTDNYFFINCGSATNANTDIRNFVGDLNSSDSISSSFSFTGHSSPVTNSNQSSEVTELDWRVKLAQLLQVAVLKDKLPGSANGHSISNMPRLSSLLKKKELERHHPLNTLVDDPD
ncbi:hypothetical protein SO802_025680 [Lithocarpus litseifolius]|uniref:Uncharacterized protein n=1 Tax=Lithocarpus litseifolius TaxID=425828 RepID=A0AAW2BXC7_9ROSI